MTSAYFIITYLMSLLFILFGSYAISVNIQTFIIKTLKGYIFICLDSTIFSTYSLNDENKCLILYVKFYLKVQLIFFSISNTFIFIYFYGFYFNIIGYFELQLLIRFYSNILCLRFEISYNRFIFIYLYNFIPHFFH